MPKNQPELKLISLEDVAVEPVRWLWYPYIPLGKLTILYGDPGEGKTTLALWIAAACSRGQALPGRETREPLTVLYQTAEDGLGDTIKPRLLESQADLQRIYTIDETDFPLSMLDHRIGEAIEKTHAQLMILDPMQAFAIASPLAQLDGTRCICPAAGDKQFHIALFNVGSVVALHSNGIKQSFSKKESVAIDTNTTKALPACPQQENRFTRPAR